MTREILLPQQNSERENLKTEKYFARMRSLYQYDLNEPYFSFNGNIACLSTQGFKKWLITMPTLKLTILTVYKLVMMIIAGINAWVKSLF
ncbi:MAG: hypothetical protein ACFCAD_03235 [Pleurocapsa sp.]